MTLLDAHPVLSPSAAGFRPTLIRQVDLARPLPDIAPPPGGDYAGVQVLVRLHTVPLGLVECAIDGAAVDAEGLSGLIWHELGDRIRAHARADGLPEPRTMADLVVHGPADHMPCLKRRRRVLDDAPMVSVIVPTRNRAERLRGCLESILASDYPPDRFEVIVVDNLPPDGSTRTFVEEAYGADDRVRYLRSDRSGSASARNDGLAVAQGRYVAFTDDDVLVDPQWLAEMIAGFSAVPHAGCVTGLIVPLELETQAQVWFEEYGGFAKGFDPVVYDLAEHRPDAALFPYSAGMFGSGNSMAFDRALLEEIGKFDPALGNGTPALGGVDLEAFFRVLVAGRALVYEPSALVHHLHRRDYTSLRRQVYNYGAGLIAFLLKALLANPRLLPDFARRVPRGAAYAISPSSTKHARKTRGYPPELRWLELKGMLHGLSAYVRSRREFGRHLRRFA